MRTDLKLSLTPDQGICIVAKNGRITYVNRRFRKLFNLAEGTLLGSALLNLPLPKQAAAALTEIIERAQQGESARFVSISFLKHCAT
jgi:PAS domain S-box-containing protein